MTFVISSTGHTSDTHIDPTLKDELEKVLSPLGKTKTIWHKLRQKMRAPSRALLADYTITLTRYPAIPGVRGVTYTITKD